MRQNKIRDLRKDRLGRQKHNARKTRFAKSSKRKLILSLKVIQREEAALVRKLRGGGKQEKRVRRQPR